MSLRTASRATSMTAALTLICLAVAAVLLVAGGASAAGAALVSLPFAAAWVGYRTDDATAAAGTARGWAGVTSVGSLLVPGAAAFLPLPLVLTLAYVVGVFHVFGTVVRSLERVAEEWGT